MLKKLLKRQNFVHGCFSKFLVKPQNSMLNQIFIPFIGYNELSYNELGYNEHWVITNEFLIPKWSFYYINQPGYNETRLKRNPVITKPGYNEQIIRSRAVHYNRV